MKKIFTLALVSLFTICSYAQVIVTSPDGTVCADGATMDLFDEFPEEADFVSFECPVLENTGSSPVSVYLNVDIKQMPEGTTLSDCFGTKCIGYDKVEAHKTDTKQIAANAKIRTNIEWSNFSNKTGDYIDGICIVEFTLYVNGQKAQTFTARYIQLDAMAVKDVKDNTTKVNGTFTVDGKRVADNAKGLLIRNGKKVLVK